MTNSKKDFEDKDHVLNEDSENKSQKGKTKKGNAEKKNGNIEDADAEENLVTRNKPDGSKKSDKQNKSFEKKSNKLSKIPLLDQSLIIDGPRTRTTVIPEKVTSSKYSPIEIPKGKGVPLMRIDSVNARLERSKPNDLKELHKYIFGKYGDPDRMVSHLKEFYGFPLDIDSDKYHTKISQLNKLHFGILKHFLFLLDLDMNIKKKEDVVRKIVNFLVKPSKSLTENTPASEIRKQRKATKRNYVDMDVEKSEIKKRKKVIGTETVEKPKKNIMKQNQSPKNSNKSLAKDDGKEESNEYVEDIEDLKKPAKKRKNQESKKSDKINKNTSNSEDVIKDEEKTILSNEELEKFLGRVLANANLQETTMKTVYGMISNRYPKFNFSSKKDFIKSIVKKLIQS